MRALLVAAAVVCVLSVSAVSPAQPRDGDWDGGYAVTKATRRNDFTLGVGGGLVSGRAYGYPNEVAKIDNGEYKVDTRSTLGGRGSVWVGMAFNDWLTFALGATTVSLASKDVSANGQGLFFRVEAFPLFSLGGSWRDVGISGNFGLSSLRLNSKEKEDASGELMSLVSFGAFYEPVRLGPLALGPMLEFTHLFSQTATSSSMQYGARVVLYSGPG